MMTHAAETDSSELSCACAGKKKVRAGDKLRFKVPLPEDEAAMERLFTPSKEALKETLAARRAVREQRAETLAAAQASQRTVWLDTAK